jgi:hypothetical protein
MTDLFSSGEIAHRLASPKAANRFHERRVRTLIVNGLIIPHEKTEGGHLRFGADQVAMAVIYSALLDMGIAHPAATSPQAYDASPFLSAQFALAFHHNGKSKKIDFTKASPEEVLAFSAANPNAITRAMTGAAKGEWWMLRIDLVRDDQTGAKRYLAVAYESGNAGADYDMPKRGSEIPMGSILVPLTPLLLPLVSDRGKAN